MIWFRCTALALTLILLQSCSRGGEDAAPGDSGSFRVAVAAFQHETCTFCPGGDTEIEDWTRLRPPNG